MKFGLGLGLSIAKDERSGLLTRIAAEAFRCARGWEADCICGIGNGDYSVRVPCDQRTGSRIVTLELFDPAAAFQPSAVALEAGLMEQEQHYPCSGVLP